MGRGLCVVPNKDSPCPTVQLKVPKDSVVGQKRRRNNGGDGVGDEMEEGRRRTRRGDEGTGGGLL